MEQLSMCRICLAEDVRMHLIAKTHLQQVYESLTLIPFETNVSKPVQACYICCARLKNCYLLRKTCLQSEELLIRKLSNNPQPINVQENNCTQRLTVVHPVIHLSVPICQDSNIKISEDNDVKKEVLAEFDSFTVKQEVAEDISLETQEECDIKSSDYEDNIPLDRIARKTEDIDININNEYQEENDMGIYYNIQSSDLENNIHLDILKRKQNKLDGITTRHYETVCTFKTALTAAEKQRRYRERRKKDPEKEASSKKKALERYHANKRLVRDLKSREHREIKKKWRTANAKRRERDRALRVHITES